MKILKAIIKLIFNPLEVLASLKFPERINDTKIKNNAFQFILALLVTVLIILLG